MFDLTNKLLKSSLVIAGATALSSSCLAAQILPSQNPFAPTVSGGTGITTQINPGDTSAAPNPMPASMQPQQQAKKNVARYCPLPSELKKNGLWWSARGVWKSYSQSFSKGISGFLGTQWIGINVGKIICIYQGTSNFEFPIALETERTFLIVAPKGENWYNIKSGYKMCKSNNVQDCPFFEKQPTDIKNIYEQIKYSPKTNQGNTDDEDFLYQN